MKNRNRKFMGNLLAASLGLLVMVCFVLFASPVEAGLVMAATPHVNLAGACSDILVQLETLAGQNTPFLLGRKTGALDYITSPMNGGVKAELTSVDQGRKLAKARVVYKQRARPCDMVSTPVGLCTTPQTPLPKEVDVTIDNYVGSKPQSFSNANMINICQDTQSFVQDYVLSFMRAGRERVSEIILANLKAAVGINYQHTGSPSASGACINKQLLGTVNSQKVPLFGNWSDMMLDYQNNQLNGVPVVIGDGNFWQFTQLSSLACCNASIPYEAAVATAGAANYIDQAASKVMGANVALMTAFGANHLLWFNENNNININTPIQQHIVVPDPYYSSLSWDLDFVFDECTKSWIFKIGAWVDVFNSYQADSFGSDPSVTPDCHDDLEGMTGNFCYTITSA
jgi:hypothetical protein